MVKQKFPFIIYGKAKSSPSLSMVKQKFPFIIYGNEGELFALL